MPKHDAWKELYRNAFLETFDSETPEESEEPETYHPASDWAFLETFAADALSSEEREELLEHIAVCPDCRRLLAFQIKAQSDFAAADAASPIIARTSRSASESRTSSRRRVWLKTLGTIAAVVLVAVGVWSYRTGDREIQVARHDLSTLLDSRPNEVFSARLTDFGYRLSGTSRVKGLSETVKLEETERKIVAAYEKLLSLAPKNDDVRRDFARFLLDKERNPTKAKSILEPCETTPETEILLGIADFLLKNDAEAQRRFRNVLSADPNNEEASLNLAISLTGSGSFDEAEPIFRKILETTDSDSLKLQIDMFLQKKNAER